MAINLINSGEWQGTTNGRLVKELWLFDSKMIEAVNLKDAAILKGGLTLSANAELMKVNFAQDSCNFNESIEETPFGIVYKPNFSFNVPHPDTSFLEYLKKVRFKFFAALFRDGNGQWNLCSGDLKILHTKLVAQKNGLEFELKADRDKPTYAMLDTSLEDLLLMPEFSVEFSNEFNS